MIQDAFLYKPDAMHAFTDSTVVLAWLKEHPKSWNTYVANRVSEIQDFLPFEQWHHVSGAQNPVDCASRGIRPSELISHPLWWEGPEFLKSGDYVFENPPNISDLELLEQRKNITIGHVSSDNTCLQKFSSLTKLQRVTAYCRRFAANCKVRKCARNFSFLSSYELRYALDIWIRIVQNQLFSSEIQACSSGELISVKSRLRSFNPFVDSSGLLRVGGRLRHAKIANDRKHPIILPTSHILTTLVIQHAHANTMHGGCQLVLATIQRKFWVVNGRDAVRREIRKCVRCCRFRAETAEQMMGDLPSFRVNPSRPFLKVGIDFAGPYTLRVLKGRGNRNYKGYIAIFICMVTRAMHLEVATSLSTESFLSAMKRFVARRGLPSDVYSDCGRTFVGASKELRRLCHSKEFANDVGSFLAQNEISWHFNPPASPHFGGLWEAGIRSVKYHLQRIMGNVTFNYEDMHTVTSQIEACLNSRPLTQLSSDPNDLTALTPGHFLIGEALTAVPEQNQIDEAPSQFSRGRIMQRVVQHFWRRWSSEYIARLQQRPKWLNLRATLKEGDLVLVKDERLPPLKWKLARILQGHPGPDGVTRVYTLKTADGVLKRPLVKLCQLPIESSE
ncbi:unnamed protein product [Allacma fusca]|uniref:Integrase catalytic domain-containing protein n=1 Tax=Allacma fusca TaxID=39272 RepID=A0A8J2L1V3_9HEXA|nr:unnamed protein product [Allacma fusca]